MVKIIGSRIVYRKGMIVKVKISIKIIIIKMDHNSLILTLTITLTLTLIIAITIIPYHQYNKQNLLTTNNHTLLHQNPLHHN